MFYLIIITFLLPGSVKFVAPLRIRKKIEIRKTQQGTSLTLKALTQQGKP